MHIKILGSGCPSCQKLEAHAKQATEDLNMTDVVIEAVHDIGQITGYGVMSTPAIVIDEQVKASGRIPDVEEIKSWLA